MNGLRRVSILLGVSLVLTLFLGGMTVLADEREREFQPGASCCGGAAGDAR